MKQEDAEKLAQRIVHSSIAPSNPNWISVGERVDIARKLAAHILSADMKREIENAAYERAANWCRRQAIALYRLKRENDKREAFVEAATAIVAMFTHAKTADTEG